jgi:hypothetical protein
LRNGLEDRRKALACFGGQRLSGVSAEARMLGAEPRTEERGRIAAIAHAAVAVDDGDAMARMNTCGKAIKTNAGNARRHAIMTTNKEIGFVDSRTATAVDSR